MLRHIKLKNFVHFYEEQDLSFSNGPHFFIGQNESGKSCMLEALRRCMSTSKSMGMSSSHVSEEPTFIMCDFQITDGRFVRSGLVCVPQTDRRDIFVKFVFILKEKDVFVDLLTQGKTGWTVNQEIDLKEETVAKFTKIMTVHDSELNKNSDVINGLSEVANEIIIEEIYDVNSYNAETKCEQFLRQQIDPVVVIVYPTRAIATGQWTKSDGFEEASRNAESTEVEKKISHKSEIMSWYFDDQKNGVKPEDRDRVRLYFRAVTNNNSFIFKKQEDGSIQIKENTTDSGHQLIKVPDGYFEAKHCAVLLGVDQHKTICIEEAGKGMHPQMIERLRDLVLKNINDKVIIITSHSPSMLSYWNISKIFFFRKIRDRNDEDRIRFSIVQGEKILSKEEQKTSRMMTNQLTSTIFFARRVLYVEGDGDHIFMTILKQVILEDEKYASIVNTFYDTEVEDTDKLKKFLYSLQFISMQGEKNKEKFLKVSFALGLQHFFLMDYDVIQPKSSAQRESDRQGSSTSSQSETPQVENFLRTMQVKNVSAEEVLKDASCLAPSGIFIWRKDEEHTTRKQGTLEHALITLVEKNRDVDLKRDFKANNVILQWDPNKETRSSHKFGNHKNLTSKNVENIIKIILNYCGKRKGFEFERLLQFLIDACNGNCGMP